MSLRTYYFPALQPNIQAVMACFVTNLSACVGGITWVLLDYRYLKLRNQIDIAKMVKESNEQVFKLCRHEKKYSALGFCAGAVGT